MSIVPHGRVKGGRILIDDTIDLPEGSDVLLRVIDDDDDNDHAELFAAIEAGREQIRRGEGIPACEVASALSKVHGG